MNDLSTQNNGGSMAALSDPVLMDSLIRFANYMAEGTIALPENFRRKPSDCLAIVLQAVTWGMSPYSIAQDTFFVNKQIAYGAKLVNAVISSSTAIEGRFHYEYSDGWEKIAGKNAIQKVKKSGSNGSYEKDLPVKLWSDEEEIGLWVRVGAVLRGEKEIQWGEKVFLSSVLTRNSPLWVTKPDQQMSYLAVKYWARLYTPAVILGVYTSDELPADTRKEVDITPEKSELNTLMEQKSKASEESKKPVSNAPVAAPEAVPEEEIKKESASLEFSQKQIFDDLIQVMAKSETLEGLDTTLDIINTKLAGEPKEKAFGHYQRRRNQIVEAEQNNLELLKDETR